MTSIDCLSARILVVTLRRSVMLSPHPVRTIRRGFRRPASVFMAARISGNPTSTRSPFLSGRRLGKRPFTRRLRRCHDWPDRAAGDRLPSTRSAGRRRAGLIPQRRNRAWWKVAPFCCAEPTAIGHPAWRASAWSEYAPDIAVRRVIGCGGRPADPAVDNRSYRYKRWNDPAAPAGACPGGAGGRRDQAT